MSIFVVSKELKTIKMELLEVENFDFEESNMKVLFDGFLKEGFYVTTEFSYDEEVTQKEDFYLGLKEYKSAMFIVFYNFKTFNSEDEEISINNRELKKIKDMVEFKLIDLLEEEINNY